MATLFNPENALNYFSNPLIIENNPSFTSRKKILHFFLQFITYNKKYLKNEKKLAENKEITRAENFFFLSFQTFPFFLSNFWIVTFVWCMVCSIRYEVNLSPFGCIW